MEVAQSFVPERDEIEKKRDHRSIGCLGKQCKKMCSDIKKTLFPQKVVYPWTYPTLHKARRWYIDFYILDPATNQMRRKKYMLSRYKSLKARREMARQKIAWIVDEVRNGWNPFVKARTTRDFSLWDTVLDRYKDYLLVAGRKGLLKSKTAYDYQSRLKNFEMFLSETGTHITYIYEFDRSLCVEFLDYLYFDKDVSAVTRNGYRTWLSTFCSWLMDKEYLPRDQNPVADIKQMREEEKKREPLTKGALAAMREYLTSRNPYFLLACYIEYYVNIRPDEMRYLKIGYIDIKNCIVTLPGKFAKNRKRQEVTVPKKVLKLMIDLGTFRSPSQYYIFGPNLRPSTEQVAVNRFRQEWSRMRKALGWPDSYQFYSLKDTGISDNIDRYGLLTARDQARHADAATTNRYAKVKHTAHVELQDWDGDL